MAIRGVKGIRQMRVPNDQTIYNSRMTNKIVDTHDYFLEQVDPLIGSCISFLLSTQPQDVLKAMLSYFQTLREKGTVELPYSDDSKKPRRELKLYLATSIGPIVAKLVNRIAISRPTGVLDFMCSELSAMEQDSEPVPNIPTRNQKSAARSKLEEAMSFADHLGVPFPEVTPPTNSILEDSAKSGLSTSIVGRPESAPPPGQISTDTRIHDISVVRSSSSSNMRSPRAKSPRGISPRATALSKDSPRKGSAQPNDKMIQIAVVGMGQSGKSSIVNMLQGDFATKSRPTNGFRPITLMLGTDTKVRFYDLGGGDKIRNIWDQYFHDVHGVLYVFDASISNELELQKSIDLFQSTIQNKHLMGKPLAVLANKMDVSGAMSVDSISSVLGLDGLGRAFGSVGVSIVPEGDEPTVDVGVESGVEWLLETVQSRYDDLHLRVVNDTKDKAKQEAIKRLEKERKVLRNKIASAFPSEVSPDMLPSGVSSSGEDVFTKEEGEQFLAGEIGEEVAALSPIALQIAACVGYQRLALQIVGALKVPISKKKEPMNWDDILSLVLELRSELGLGPI